MFAIFTIVYTASCLQMFTIKLSNVDIIAVMYGPQKFIHWVILV